MSIYQSFVRVTIVSVCLLALLSSAGVAPAGAAPDGATGGGEDRYAINLLSNEGPIDMTSQPKLPAFERFKLYTTRVKKGGKTWHRLRLGFFSTLEEAERTFASLRGHYPDGIIRWKYAC